MIKSVIIMKIITIIINIVRQIMVVEKLWKLKSIGNKHVLKNNELQYGEQKLLKISMISTFTGIY